MNKMQVPIFIRLRRNPENSTYELAYGLGQPPEKIHLEIVTKDEVKKIITNLRGDEHKQKIGQMNFEMNKATRFKMAEYLELVISSVQ